MKKLTLLTAASAMFFMVSCSSDKTSDTTSVTTEEQDHDHDHHEGMAHGEEVVASQPLETPDFSSVAAPFKRNVSQMVDQYLQLKDAFVNSDANAASKEAQTLLKSANALPVATLQSPDQKEFAEEQNEKVKEAASGIANSSDMKAQRDHLEKLSVAVFSLTKAFGVSDKKLYYQHCPMAQNNKGGYWLSKDQEIRNPYFGDKMLKCGENVEELN